MKNYRKYLLTIFAVLLLALCIPYKVEAKDVIKYSVAKLTANVWTQIQCDSEVYKNSNHYYTDYAYKFSVPADSYIKLEIKTAEAYAHIDLYKSLNRNKRYFEQNNYTHYFVAGNKTETIYKVIP